MDQNSRGHHEWIVEFYTPPTDPEAFAEALDKALQEVNSDYEAKRYKDITLARLKLHVLAGLFAQWLSRHGKMGGQNKVPRLKNDRSIMDELLTMM